MPIYVQDFELRKGKGFIEQNHPGDFRRIVSDSKMRGVSNIDIPTLSLG